MDQPMRRTLLESRSRSGERFNPTRDVSRLQFQYSRERLKAIKNQPGSLWPIGAWYLLPLLCNVLRCGGIFTRLKRPKRQLMQTNNGRSRLISSTCLLVPECGRKSRLQRGRAAECNREIDHDLRPGLLIPRRPNPRETCLPNKPRDVVVPSSSVHRPAIGRADNRRLPGCEERVDELSKKRIGLDEILAVNTFVDLRKNA